MLCALRVGAYQLVRMRGIDRLASQFIIDFNNIDTAVDLYAAMALAAREVQVAAGDDHAIAVERKLVVDPQSGMAAQVENVAVAVQLEDGTVGVARQQRIHIVQQGGSYM